MERSTSGRVDGQGLDRHKGTVFALKKEGNYGTCYNVVEDLKLSEMYPTLGDREDGGEGHSRI